MTTKNFMKVFGALKDKGIIYDHDALKNLRMRLNRRV
jgi:hypothetical protein